MANINMVAEHTRSTRAICICTSMYMYMHSEGLAYWILKDQHTDIDIASALLS